MSGEMIDARVWAERFVYHVKQNPAIATDQNAMRWWFAAASREGRVVDAEGRVLVLSLSVGCEIDPDDLDLARLREESGASLVVVLAPGATLDVIDEDEMRALGWARVVNDA